MLSSFQKHVKSMIDSLKNQENWEQISFNALSEKENNNYIFRPEYIFRDKDILHIFDTEPRYTKQNHYIIKNFINYNISIILKNNDDGNIYNKIINERIFFKNLLFFKKLMNYLTLFHINENYDKIPKEIDFFYTPDYSKIYNKICLKDKKEFEKKYKIKLPEFYDFKSKNFIQLSHLKLFETLENNEKLKNYNPHIMEPDKNNFLIEQKDINVITCDKIEQKEELNIHTRIEKTIYNKIIIDYSDTFFILTKHHNCQNFNQIIENKRKNKVFIDYNQMRLENLRKTLNEYIFRF